MKKSNILLSPTFLLALILLLINDFYLKYQYANFLTGKLSDFAGLFLVPIYFSVLLPKYRKGLHIATALLFIWWKSSFSTDFIEMWNNFAPFSIARTIDSSDNIALIMIPLAYIYWEKFEENSLPKAYIYFSLGLSFFAFAATSKPYEEPAPIRHIFQYHNQYILNIQEDTIHQRMLDAHYNVSKRSHIYDINIPEQTLSDIRFFLKDTDTGTCVLSLEHLYAWEYMWDTVHFFDSLTTQKMFEKQFIDSLFVQ